MKYRQCVFCIKRYLHHLRARKRMSEATNELSTLAAKTKRCVDKKKRHVDSSLHKEPPTKKAKSSKPHWKE